MNTTTAEHGGEARPAAPVPALWQRRLLAAVIVAVGVWVFWTSAQRVLADTVSISARSHVRQWSLGVLAATDADVSAAQRDIRRAVRVSPDDPNVWEDLGEVEVLLAKRAGVELLRRAAAPADQAASAAKVASAAEAASRPARTLEEFRRRAKQAELEAQRKILQGAASQPVLAPPPAAPAPATDSELKQAVVSHFEQAREAYLQSIELRPNGPGAWARLAGVYLGLEQKALYLQAWRKAVQLGPYESNVQAECLLLVMLDWDHAEPDQIEWAKNLYDSASETRRRAINRAAAGFGLVFAADEAADAASAAAPAASGAASR